jgi:hypothetical protein
MSGLVIDRPDLFKEAPDKPGKYFARNRRYLENAVNPINLEYCRVFGIYDGDEALARLIQSYCGRRFVLQMQKTDVLASEKYPQILMPAEVEITLDEKQHQILFELIHPLSDHMQSQDGQVTLVLQFKAERSGSGSSTPLLISVFRTNFGDSKWYNFGFEIWFNERMRDCRRRIAIQSHTIQLSPNPMRR